MLMFKFLSTRNLVSFFLDEPKHNGQRCTYEPVETSVMVRFGEIVNDKILEKIFLS